MTRKGHEQQIPRGEGRNLFGSDPAAYDSARPEYPSAVYAILQERCGLSPGTRTLEIGAGSGLATRELIALGANLVVAIEPDRAMAERLRTAPGLPAAVVEVHVTPFEDVELPCDAFDLAVAATSFHWIDPGVGLAKVRRLLRPGGAWAMWWNNFGDPDRADAFHEATHDLLGPLPLTPSNSLEGQLPFALDVDARTAELKRAEFEAIDHAVMRWPLVLNPAGVRALYGTFSNLTRLPEPERERLLDRVADVAATEFGGSVERNMVTTVYTARRPHGTVPRG